MHCPEPPIQEAELLAWGLLALMDHCSVTAESIFHNFFFGPTKNKTARKTVPWWAKMMPRSRAPIFAISVSVSVSVSATFSIRNWVQLLVDRTIALLPQITISCVLFIFLLCFFFFKLSAKTSQNTRSKGTRWEKRESLGQLHILLLWKTIQTLLFLLATCCQMMNNKEKRSALSLPS